MAMILVDGVEIKTPSSFTYTLQDISGSDSGRTMDAVMHKNRVAQKIKISLGWNNPTPEETSAILKAFDPEYIKVTYPDAKENKDVTKEFYVGDRTAPIYSWAIGRKRYTQISFDIIER